MSKKLTFEDVEKYFKDSNCELLESEYKNNCTKMRYRCDSGNISEIRFDCFKQDKRCKQCAVQKRREKISLSYSYVEKYFEDNDCKLLEKEYKNAHIPIRYKCSCGNISRIAFISFQQGSRCR